MKEVELFPDDPKSQLEQVSSISDYLLSMSLYHFLFLLQEIKLLSNLQHPNIVHYFGSEIVSIFIYIYILSLHSYHLTMEAAVWVILGM